MFCMNCGKQLPDDAKFCLVCGVPVGQIANQAGKITVGKAIGNTAMSSTPELGADRRIKADIAKIDEYYKKATDFCNRREYDASANQARQALETMVNHLLWRGHLQFFPSAAGGIYLLANSKYDSHNYIIDKASEKNYHSIRMVGNSGSHSGRKVSKKDCEAILYLLKKEIKKFKEVYVQKNYEHVIIKTKKKYSLIEEIASRGVGVLLVAFGICIIVLTLYSISKSNDFYADYNQHAPSYMQKNPNNTIVLIPSIIISIIFILIGLACVIGGPKIVRILRELGILRF